MNWNHRIIILCTRIVDDKLEQAEIIRSWTISAHLLGINYFFRKIKSNAALPEASAMLLEHLILMPQKPARSIIMSSR
jgi:hypothetical protein